MNILDKIDSVGEVTRILMESGIRNIRLLASEYKEATIYFHKDT